MRPTPYHAPSPSQIKNVGISSIRVAFFFPFPSPSLARSAFLFAIRSATSLLTSLPVLADPHSSSRSIERRGPAVFTACNGWGEGMGVVCEGILSRRGGAGGGALVMVGG